MKNYKFEMYNICNDGNEIMAGILNVPDYILRNDDELIEYLKDTHYLYNDDDYQVLVTFNSENLKLFISLNGGSIIIGEKF